MQHGALTPLGRQLRAVLANLSAPANPRRPRTVTTSPPNDQLRRGPRAFSQASARPSQATAGAQSDTASPEAQVEIANPQEPASLFRTHSQRRLRRRQQRGPANDDLTEALRETGRHASVPAHRPWKLNLSHVNAKSQNIWAEYKARIQRLRNRPPPRERVLSLQSITSAYIRRRPKADEDAIAESEKPFMLTASEESLLRHNQYTLDDVAAWAGILYAHDSLGMAQNMRHHLETNGPHSVPIWVLLYALRRPYVSARALRILIECTSTVFDYRTRALSAPAKHTSDVFIAAMRLIRHARVVWPQALKIPVHLMLDHLRHRKSIGVALTNTQLAHVTYLLNKLMHLVSIATALQPFKDNVYQEAGLVSILQFMAEHSPPLQINRQGYRAVVRIQLLQRKSTEEQQWAELKSLSWPPWKVDRTAMDTAIGPEHGISKAGSTLARMRDAGYRPLYWERTAELYTGWDVDRTPTIQMRALLNPPGYRLSTKLQGQTHPWDARIQSTRTIQEAWACYLAWEDEKLPPDQDVYLAIFNKLLEEQRRQKQFKSGLEYDVSSLRYYYWPVWPGDAREISPPPPSTHLYTYTRTPPPSVSGLYRRLHHDGVVLEDYCLALVIQHASSLEEGLERLQTASSRWPAIQSLMMLSTLEDVSKVPRSIFAATINLYARFPKKSLSVALSRIGSTTEGLEIRCETLPRFRMNMDNPVVYAIELLRVRSVSSPEAWSAIVLSLTSLNSIPRLNNTLKSDMDHRRAGYVMHPSDLDFYEGALNGYRLVLRTLRAQQDHHVDMDTRVFLGLCRSTTFAATASWHVLRHHKSSNASLREGPQWHTLVREVTDIVQDRRSHVDTVKANFRILVGEDQAGTRQAISERDEASTVTDVPRLLSVPNPAMLHAYIRALGWLADFDGLLATVHWMREYRTELDERQHRDRLGADMMRKAMVALRVFLERSWVADATPGSDPDDVGQYEGEDEGDKAEALLVALANRAPDTLIDEVREVVGGVEEWGGWPTDEEVQNYMSAATGVMGFDGVKPQTSKPKARNSSTIDLTTSESRFTESTASYNPLVE